MLATTTQTILHLGCGLKKWPAAELLPYVGLSMDVAGAEIIHADADPDLTPDMVCDLGHDAITLSDNSVDTILAWHVLEHVGQQGEAEQWFRAWEEMYRVLKPGGMLYGESPYYDGIWAWSDPTHTRVISEHSFVFFNQDSYRIESSAISPYRLTCDFQWLGFTGMERGWAVITDPKDSRNRMIRFALQAIKPLTPWWVRR